MSRSLHNYDGYCPWKEVAHAPITYDFCLHYLCTFTTVGFCQINDIYVDLYKFQVVPEKLLGQNNKFIKLADVGVRVLKARIPM